jgi:hypothetical protein
MIFECWSDEVLKENAMVYSKRIQTWNTESHWQKFLTKFRTDSQSTKEIA